MLNKLQEIEKEALKAIKKAGLPDHLEQVKAQYVGRSGILNDIIGDIGGLPKEERPEVGKIANQIKQKITASLEIRHKELSSSASSSGYSQERVDVTALLHSKERGSIHPISQVQAEMEQIFLSMGFDILDGPHIESEFYNFEALNIPEDHPAREHQDTFWLTCGLLLRTHTSSVQVRAYKTSEPPFAAVIPGRIFRYEAVDASHENTFHQIEGFIVDTDISIANLIAVLKTVVKEIFKRDIKIRLRPGYFPFVEPGYEMDFECLICEGEGCSVCSRTGWVEFLGCGMIHPNVLTFGNIDPEKYTGFAFGMGLDRLTMMLYKIDNIRIFQGCDLRVLKQFSSPSLL
ncbi:phenylalanine--tRNA ligase subunit alpha [Planctomycetota bacterium]